MSSHFTALHGLNRSNGFFVWHPLPSDPRAHQFTNDLGGGPMYAGRDSDKLLTHDERLRHFRRYQAKELLRKASEAGWVVSRLTYSNTLLFPLALCARFMDKIFPSAPPRGTSIPAKAINALMCFVFSFERNVLRAFNLPFGMSLLDVLKAP